MRETVAGIGGLALMVIVFGVSFLIFLLMREVWCWYWKINAALALLQDMQRTLRNIDQHVAADFAAKQKPVDHFGDLPLNR